MLRKRWARPLAYTAAILTAFILAMRGIANDVAAGWQSGSVHPILIAAMAFGMLISAYGLYVERHSIRALILRRIEVEWRLARRDRLYKARRKHSPTLQVPSLTAEMTFSLRDWFAPRSTSRHPRTYP